MKMTPEQHLMEGVKILSPYLEPLGFRFELLGTGKSSGGALAYGHFVKSGGLFDQVRKIEFHFRYSLGLVSYAVGKQALSHQDYVDLLGQHGQNKYPNFSDDPQESFHCLLWDLQHILNDFTEHKAAIFRQKVPGKLKEIAEQQEALRLQHQKKSSGDQALIEQATIAFRKGDYQEVDRLKRQLMYPALLSKTERKLFELNDERM